MLTDVGKNKMDWVRWMYREEKLHSSVLAELLTRDIGRERSVVAEALLAVESPGHAVSAAIGAAGAHDTSDPRTDPVQLESRVARRSATGTRRSVDLSCLLEVGVDEEARVQRRMLVETKVDSPASREQLSDMSWANDHTLLLALGTTAFTHSQSDLDRDADAGFVTFQDDHLADGRLSPASVTRRGDRARSWTLIGPDHWATALRAVRDNDPRAFRGLEAYLERIELEVRLHERAREDAQRGGVMEEPPAHPQTREVYDRGVLLMQAAWCGLVRQWLGGSRAAIQGLNLVPGRDASTLKTVVFPPGWSGDGEPSVYLEAGVGTDQGRLVAKVALKAAGSQEFRRAMYRQFGQPGSAARAAGKTTTLTTSTSQSGHPQDAVEWVTATTGALDEHVRRIRVEYGATGVVHD